MINKNKQFLTSVEQKTIEDPSILCFSHLRWDFVFQRPQHLLTRASVKQQIFFFEEAIFEGSTSYYTEKSYNENRIIVITPHIPSELMANQDKIIPAFIEDVLSKHNVNKYLLWFYTPMMLPFTRQLKPEIIIYDCMDELSLFAGAPAGLKNLEKELLEKADVVFTGGRCLYEYKKNHHNNIHCFPSSIDKEHFAKAKKIFSDPKDQADIPHPRIGYFGVIDERLDINLLDLVSKAKPDWHFIMVGPIVKIDPKNLPGGNNIHYLGPKSYEELPFYIAGWDIAFLPFAMNDSTRFISPTKTPEYLAAGKPVVSTSITDVIKPYGENKFVKIADTPEEFIPAVEEYLYAGRDQIIKKKIEDFLNSNSWDLTWKSMYNLIRKAFRKSEVLPKTGSKIHAA